MGVTIHFEGKLKSAEYFGNVIHIIKEFCAQNNMPYFVFEDKNKLLERVKDDEDWDYINSVRGITVQPDENTDLLTFEFDENCYIQDYCKTQFADISVHIKIIDLLRKISSSFENLEVIDEGEYWDTSDAEYLQQLINECLDRMAELKSQNSKLIGPYRIKSGRIIDLMEG